jgi:hypothetical protein
MKTKIMGALCIAFLIMSFTSILAMAQTPQEPHAADAMWIEPSSSTFNASSTPVDTAFNITVWMNITENVFAYQIGLHYNRTQLKCNRAAYTAGATSEYFQGHTTSSPPPAIDTSSLGNGSILAFETLLGSDFLPGPHVGSLMWAEFQILIVPTSGNLTSMFNISFETQPSQGNNWVEDENLNNIPITAFDATYFIGAAPPPPPKPLNVSINPSPSVSVSVNQTLLFTSTVTGGTPTYTYQWFLNGSAISGATSASWTFSSMTNDTYDVYLNVTDSLGASQKSTDTLVTVVFRLYGDVNGDGRVDGKDAAAVAHAFGTIPGSPNWDPNADLNGDGRVDGRDLILIVRIVFSKGLPFPLPK